MTSYVVDSLVVITGVLSALYLRMRDNAERFPKRQVEELFLYPIKSLPPISVPSVKLTPRGFQYDRTFILVTPLPDGTYKNQMISSNPANTLITPSITTPSASTGPILTLKTATSTFSVPLEPSAELISTLEHRTVNLHQSPIEGLDMGDEAAKFFTAACGVESRLVWTGMEGKREVLGTMSQGKDSGIAFQDCASYMLATTASLAALSKNLGRPMPIVPLRPSIFLSPRDSTSKLKAWSEDYWSCVQIGRDVTIRLTANCVRCVSLNIDYATGKRLEGPNLPLGALSKDRRVDVGTPNSPVFGRYGFSESVGSTISVGDPVAVLKLNAKRTVFDWPGM